MVATPTTSTLPALQTEAARMRRLVVMRRRATGMLFGVAAVYLAVLLLTDGEGVFGWVRAGAEASMVGGLADWFAVTAVFRHPLGLPIPHTAVIPARKDQFGQTLGEFVQRSFLTPEIIVERVRSAGVASRGAQWLVAPGNAERVARHVADAAVALTDAVKDDDVHRAMEETVRNRVQTLPLAPLAGRALRLATADGRHRELLDALLRGIDRFLDESRDELRDRFGREIPRWIPGAVEDRIFERVIDGLHKALHEVVSDPDHDVRRRFEARLATLVDDLETSPDLHARGEQLKRELLDHPQLRDWTAALWRDIKGELRAQADDAESELRHRLAGGVRAFGERLLADPSLAARVEGALETGVSYVATQFHDEIATLVSTTIERWDASETSRRLELLLGPDLQFIRINGTVVGGLAGLAIYAFGGFGG